MDKFEKGTILYDLQPHCNALLSVMRTEKDKKGKTYQQISDDTGITMDAIKRFYTGEHKQPSVYKIAALCRYFGLSMDALFGFVPTDKTVAYTELEEKDAEIASLREQNKILKDEMATQRVECEGRIAEYKSLITDLKKDKSELVASLKSRNVHHQAQLAEKENEYKSEFQEIKADYKEEMKRKNRIIRILGISLGAFVVLVLALLIIY